MDNISELGRLRYQLERLGHTSDMNRRRADTLAAELAHERERAQCLIMRLELSGDRYVRYAIDKYLADVVD